MVGLAIGLAFTAAVAFVQQWLTRRFGEAGGSPILVNLLIPFGAYLIAERLHASGILAAVAAGIAMSYVELTGRSMARTRIERTAVWNTVQFSLARSVAGCQTIADFAGDIADNVSSTTRTDCPLQSGISAQVLECKARSKWHVWCTTGRHA